MKRVIDGKQRPVFVSVRNITVSDDCFGPFIDKLRSVTVPDVLRKFMADGAIEN